MTFARKPYPRQPKPALVLKAEPSRAVMRRSDARLTVMPKTDPVRSEAYRRLVAILPCDLCGIAGYSQAAHPNTGKGQGTKTDDRECFPLCCARPLVAGCHAQFDQGALMTKPQRRAYEPEASRRTRARIDSMGLWPANLERLDA